MRADTILLAVCLIPVPLCDVPWNMENCEWFWPELSLINDIIFYIQHKQWTFFFCHAYVDLNRNCSWCITNPMPWSSCQQCLLQIISDSVPFSCLIYISKEPKMCNIMQSCCRVSMWNDDYCFPPHKCCSTHDSLQQIVSCYSQNEPRSSHINSRY